MSITNVFCSAIGRVQNVMFRQTIIKGALKRGLQCGATNNKDDTRKVEISLTGPKENIDDFLNILRSGKELNSWGAYVDRVEMNDNGIPPLQHKINSNNVNTFNWNQNIDFYL